MLQPLPLLLLLLLLTGSNGVHGQANQAITAAPGMDGFAARCKRALSVHITQPYPAVGPDGWGEMNLALAKLARDGAANVSVAAEISAQVESWPSKFMPWNNYTVKCTLGGLGDLPILARMALLPELRALLSPAAVSALEELFFGWLSPRSKVKWAADESSWRRVDGSENLDATRKAGLYLAALVLNRTSPGRVVELDGRPVHEHAAAWEAHWASYFRHRAANGIGVELVSPTYAKYAIQNYVNMVDLSPGLGQLASAYLQLYVADAAQAFLPSTGVCGGAHTRVYRNAAFFEVDEFFASLAWLWGWWDTADVARLDNALSAPQVTLFATSGWQPAAVVTAAVSSRTAAAFLYKSRRMGNVERCDQLPGPVDPGGAKIANASCAKTPCSPCRVCGGVLAFDGSSCDTLRAGPTTVEKLEYVGQSRLFTLGAVRIDYDRDHNVSSYVAGLIQNHQVGAFFGGANPPWSRIVFGDSGSTDCSALGFLRHSYGGISSRLVPGAVAVARPYDAKINGCPAAAGAACRNEDFPLYAYVSADLYATKTIVAGGWTCFNAANETYACIGLASGRQLSPVRCFNGRNGAPGQWNGTLLLFNGSSTTTDIGVLQTGTAAADGSFAAFAAKMAGRPIPSDGAAGIRYPSLLGDMLELGAGARSSQARPWVSSPDTYASPYISAPYTSDTAFKVTLSAPGHQDMVLDFGTEGWGPVRRGLLKVGRAEIEILGKKL